MVHTVKNMLDKTYISTLESGTQSEIEDALTNFYSEHENTFDYAFLKENDDRKRLWHAIFKLLQDSNGTYIAMSLKVLRLLTRDKCDLDMVVGHDEIKVLSDLIAETDANKIMEFDTKLEALKCLNNLVLNSAKVRNLPEVCCTLPAILKHCSQCSKQELLDDLTMFRMRLIFLVTAYNPKERTELRKNHDGIGVFVNILRQLIPEFDGLIKDNVVRNLQEILKTLFNITWGVTESEPSLDELVVLVRAMLAKVVKCTDKPDVVVKEIVNLLTMVPGDSLEKLMNELDKNEDCNKVNEQDQFSPYYMGYDMSAILTIVDFMEHQLQETKGLRELEEQVCPSLLVLFRCARYRAMRKFLRKRILPPRQDIMHLPESGNTLRSHLCRLLTSPSTYVKTLVAELLFVLCKEKVSRLVKHTGYGNAAGLLAERGLMLGGQSETSYSSESEDSDTEEYLKHEDSFNPITGRSEPPRPDPMAGMTDEQKEHEVIRLVNMIDKLDRSGHIRPMRIGEDGKPHPVSHVLELQESLPQTGRTNKEE